MWIEAWKLKQAERNKKSLSEKQLKNSIEKQIRFQKTKEKIGAKIKAEDEIFNLKQLINSWIITEKIAKDVIEWKNIDNKTIKEIFDKIDEIEDIKNVDDLLPKELRVTSWEYFKAISDEIFRVQTITKLDSALTLISNKINPDSSMWLNLFSWFLTILDKNLIKIQENTIDIKNSLKKVDKNQVNTNIGLIQKIIYFFKNLN